MNAARHRDRNAKENPAWLARMTAVLAALAASCSSGVHSEGLDPSSLPTDVRADYAVFAQRCSKCHSLARPLNSGISDDDYWSMYVERMRRQPASGISAQDTVPILRFLHYHSLEQQQQKKKAPAPDSSSSSQSPSKASG